MSRRILIVDDHPGFRRSAARTLAAAGWSVVGEAENAAAAMEATERLAPEVVLLDVGLPDGSGLDVAARLLKQRPELAVVVISTHDRDDYGELALASGARRFLSKTEISGRALDALVES